MSTTGPKFTPDQRVRLNTKGGERFGREFGPLTVKRVVRTTTDFIYLVEGPETPECRVFERFLEEADR